MLGDRALLENGFPPKNLVILNKNVLLTAQGISSVLSLSINRDAEIGVVVAFTSR